MKEIIDVTTEMSVEEFYDLYFCEADACDKYFADSDDDYYEYD